MSSGSAVPKSGEVYYAEDGTVSIVLDDNYDPNYEPPEKEVAEYAKWLGIDVDNERDLLWIARDGLKAPLPSEWKPCKTDTGDVYYFNFKSGESIWDHPMDEVYKKKVEDERAKLVKSGKAPAKLVKGGAGSITDKAKPMSRIAIEEVRPKSGRLGAIGTNEEQRSQRPDISALLPTKTEQLASTLGLGKVLKKEPLKDLREMERTLRAKYDAEFDSIRLTLAEKHEKQFQEVKSNLESDKRKQINILKQDIDDEVDQARRNGERRNKRELGLYEESIDKQREDLRRTLRSVQEKLEADSAGMQRRVETELADKRTSAEKALTEDIGRRRQEIQNAWQQEKANTEMQTHQTIRELRSAHDVSLEQIRQKESQGLASQVQILENSLVSELAAVKSQLESERAAHTQQLRAAAENAAAGASALYRSANEDYQRAVAAARQESERRLNAAREEEVAETNRVLALAEQRRQEASRQAADQSRKGSQEKMDARRAYAADRIREAKEELDKTFENEKKQFAEETQLAVSRAQHEATSAAAADASTSAERIKQESLAQRQRSLSDADAAHERRLAAIRAEGGAGRDNSKDPRTTSEFQIGLSEKKAQWVRDHPQAFYHLPQLPAVPVFDPSSVKIEPIVVEREVSAAPTKDEIAAFVTSQTANLARTLERERHEKLDALAMSLRQSFEAEVAAHRSKAMIEMNNRLAAYQSSGGSPLRAARARVAGQTSAPSTEAPGTSTTPFLSHKEADAQVMSLRSSLQQRLDALRADLAREFAAASEELKDAQAEMESATAYAASVAHTNPRPLSASGAHYQVPRAQTADAGYFQDTDFPRPATRSTTPGPVPVVPGSLHTTPSREKKKRSSTFEDRLSKANDLLHRKKKDLKARQRQLEEVRGDWKADMAAAKASRDQEQIRTLKRVAAVLETDARKLNREAVALKESYEWLKSQGEAYFHEKQQNRGGGGTGTYGPGAAAGDLGMLLADMLRKADTVEAQVTHAEGRRPSPAPDAMYAKWATWLQRQPREALPIGDGGAAGPEGTGKGYEDSPKKRDVEMWLKEQQRPSHR